MCLYFNNLCRKFIFFFFLSPVLLWSLFFSSLMSEFIFGIEYGLVETGGHVHLLLFVIGSVTFKWFLFFFSNLPLLGNQNKYTHY